MTTNPALAMLVRAIGTWIVTGSHPYFPGRTDELREGVERRGLLLGQNIRAVSYLETEGRYAFRVGDR